MESRIRIIARHAKSRREQRIPLRADLVAALKAYRAATRAQGHPDGAKDPVIPARLFPSHRCFRRDIDYAKIPHEDEEGRVLDRHALRHSFVTRLAQADVHPRTAQELARHSDISLTMKHYTHLRSRDLHSAVERAADVPLLSGTCSSPHFVAQNQPREKRCGRLQEARWARFFER